MRLHELSITAFGPFVATVSVDFDELAAGGVFLLTGDTGAGKTSVLDAVCFALYGEVPGDRHSARHLRSDQADPGAEPRVVLALSIGERTFRFTRSPRWDRPKRRGGGTTAVQAHVVVEEQRQGQWLTLTNRLDEAGQLVTGLLGMTCTQFTQVAMLPQGRFQAFLRATSAERHAVLQRLFRTRRFEDVERWLVDRRLDLHRRSQTCHDRTAGVLNRLQEAAGTGVPDGWDLQALDSVVAEGSLLAWAHELSRSGAETAGVLQESLAAADRRLDLDRAACDRGKLLAQARLRGERARQVLTDLEATTEVERALVESVEGHRRAAAVLPSALRTEAAAEAAAETQEAAAHHVAVVAPVLGLAPDDVRPGILAEAATRAAEARAVAASWLPRETELRDHRARLASLTTRRARLEREIVAADQEHEDLAAQREQAATMLVEARNVAAEAEPRRLAVETAGNGLAAARQVVPLNSQLLEARALLDDTTRHALALKELHLDLREQRISGMAAELAGGLAVGCSCPVCGSAEHPTPATVSTNVSRADEDLARQRSEDADFERQAVKESVTALETRLEGARSRSADRDARQWQQVHAAATLTWEQAVQAATRVPELETQLKSSGERHHELVTTLAASRATLDATTQQRVETALRCDQLAAELTDLLAAHPDVGSVTALVERHAESIALLEEARDALTRHERAALELAQATAAACSAAESEGFASLADAMQAVLPGSEAAARSALLDTRRAHRTAATRTLEEPLVAEALVDSALDVSALTAAVRESGRLRDEAHAAHQQARTRMIRLTALGTELTEEVTSWEPVRREHALTAGLASLVEGRSAENQLKMRLSAYVLSERLRQVVAAANDRLADMTDQRYALEQTDERGAGEQRGGLSLQVRDEWSGKRRDPATLSGGETFLVSLALALGLADTVSHEAGGTQLDTLFIDEGFGALDASTLDAVMDTLDSLRDGGRVVGLVSHVAELRNRVPSQLEVRKARQGSTLCVTLANG